LLTAPRKSKFAHTKQSLTLLERLAHCLGMGEPALLVGETGTGKTSVVQYLADQLDQKLVVQNLSQQTDSSDLLGGFKPVEMRILCIPLKAKFDQLFPKTFSKKVIPPPCVVVVVVVVVVVWFSSCDYISYMTFVSVRRPTPSSLPTWTRPLASRIGRSSSSC
jgi:midasin (ATPase involved in ribosome maturation)